MFFMTKMTKIINKLVMLVTSLTFVTTMYGSQIEALQAKDLFDAMNNMGH